MGPNGGYLAAIVLRAMVAEVGEGEREPRSLTLHYLRPPADGPVHIAVTVERAGRSLSSVTARLEQDGRVCIIARRGLRPALRDRRRLRCPRARREAVGRRSSPGRRTSRCRRSPTACALARRSGPRRSAAPTRRSPGGWVAPARARARRRRAPGPARRRAGCRRSFRSSTAPVGAPTIDLTVHFRHPAAARRPSGRRPAARRSSARRRRTTATSKRTERSGPPTARCWPRAVSSRCCGRCGRRPGERRSATSAWGRTSATAAPICRPRSARSARARRAWSTASSSTYDTDPVGEVLDQDDVPQRLHRGSRPPSSPEALLDACKAVERELGRDVEGGPCATARGRSTSTCCCSATLRTRSERLTLPHEQATITALRPHPAARARPRAATPDGTRLRDVLAQLPLDEGVRAAGPPLSVER